MPGPAPTLLLRELRGEIKLFAFAAMTMAAATAALTLVLSLANSFETTYAASSRALLGGDVALRLSQREFSDSERDWLKQNSAAFSEIRTTRALAIADKRTQLVRLKGVDAAYPLFGELRLQTPPHDTSALLADDAAQPDGAYPAYIGKNLSDLLDLGVGDAFAVGGLNLRVVNFVTEEPDPDPRLFVGAPLVLVGKQAMESEGFTRPGALAARHIRLGLGDDVTVADWKLRLEGQFPDAGWRVRGGEDRRSSMLRVVGEVRNFLSLASLAALLLAGIGCGNALSAFLRARIRAIAVIKMVGGESALIRRIYLSLAALFAAGGAAVGAIGGMSGMFVIAPLLSPYLPFPLQVEWSATVLFLSFAAAVMITAAFAMPPVLRFARINPLTLFAAGGNEDQSPPAQTSDRLVMAAAFTAAALLLPLPWREKILLGGVVAVAVALYAATLSFSLLAEKIGGGSGGWRLGFLAIVRNRRQTAAAVTSFGIGVFVLTAIMNSESNFTARIDDTLRRQAPALYLTGILPSQHTALDNIVTANGGTLRTIPFIRGRISAIGGRRAEDIASDPNTDPDELWILRGDRAFTWTDGDYIGGSHVSDGVLWDDSVNGLQASIDKEAAVGFGVKLGDVLELNILGESAKAVITSFRNIDWDSFDLNFVVLLSSAPFADVPHTFMGGAYLPNEATTNTQRAVAEQLPNIVPISTGAVFDVITRLLARAAGMLQATAIFLMLCGLPMILATVIEHRRRRLQNAATLRLLGARRRTIIVAGVVEFSVMATLAALPAALLGTVAGRLIVEHLFSLDWQAQWQTLFAVVAASVFTFLFIGAADIARTVKQPPLPLLRNE